MCTVKNKKIRHNNYYNNIVATTARSHLAALAWFWMIVDIDALPNMKPSLDTSEPSTPLLNKLRSTRLATTRRRILDTPRRYHLCETQQRHPLPRRAATSSPLTNSPKP